MILCIISDSSRTLERLAIYGKKDGIELGRIIRSPLTSDMTLHCPLLR